MSTDKVVSLESRRNRKQAVDFVFRGALAEYLELVLESGDYKDAEECIVEALQIMQEAQEERERNLNYIGYKFPKTVH
jgi:hypothetical protein